MACRRDMEELVTQLAQTRLAKSLQSESTEVGQVFSFFSVRGREVKGSFFEDFIESIPGVRGGLSASRRPEGSFNDYSAGSRASSATANNSSFGGKFPASSNSSCSRSSTSTSTSGK